MISERATTDLNSLSLKELKALITTAGLGSRDDAGISYQDPRRGAKQRADCQLDPIRRPAEPRGARGFSDSRCSRLAAGACQCRTTDATGASAAQGAVAIRPRQPC